MAQINVSTWAELVAALSDVPSTAGVDTTILLTADIDMNDVAPEGTGVQIESKWWYQTLTINGGYTDPDTGEQKNHVIKNLRTPIGSTANLFYFKYTDTYGSSNVIYTKFINLDFQNINLATGNFVDWDSSKLQNFVLTLENCRFVGSRGNWYLVGKNPYTTTHGSPSIICNECYFDLPWHGAGQTNLAYTSLIPKDDSVSTNVVANYCRFKETYGNWTYSSNYGMSPTIRVYSFSYFKCSGCRIEGSMTVPVWQNTTLAQYNSLSFLCAFFSLPNNSYIPTAQNVFDVSLICDDTGMTEFNKVVGCSGFSYLVKMDAKCKSDGSACTYTTNGADSIDGASRPLPLLATPAQMKDAQWLSNNGFDIVVPD